MSHVPLSSSSGDRVLAMLGPHQFELVRAREIASEFGWILDIADNMRLRTMRSRKQPSAVLLHRQALGSACWLEALLTLRRALPDTRIIICHGFSEWINWPELSEAGAFHQLCLPFSDSELRQSLGFAWQAVKRMSTAQPKEPTITVRSSRTLAA